MTAHINKFICMYINKTESPFEFVVLGQRNGMESSSSDCFITELRHLCVEVGTTGVDFEVLAEDLSMNSTVKC